MTRRFFIKGDFIEKGRPSRPASRSRGGVPQYPVRLPPRPMTSPTQNQAYTSPAKRAATPTCETKEGKEKRRASVRKHPESGSIARAERSSSGVDGSRERGGGPARGEKNARLVCARSRAGRGGEAAHETHLGHGKLHAVRPLLLNHLNLTLGALDHGRKPERGWKETGGVSPRSGTIGSRQGGEHRRRALGARGFPRARGFVRG